MEEIVDQSVSQLEVKTQHAIDTLKKRQEEFTRSIVKAFEDAEGDIQAFGDPDFQYVVRMAALQFARTGTDELRETLVHLITERSACSNMSRIRLSLNAAIETASNLTREEFSLLTLVFLVQHTWMGRCDKADFAKQVNSFLIPLLDDITSVEASSLYLQSLSCASPTAFKYDISVYLLNKHAGLFFHGLPNADSVTSNLDATKMAEIQMLLIPCLNDPNRIQIDAMNEYDFQNKMKNTSFTEPELTAIYKHFKNTLFTRDELKEDMERAIPRIADLLGLWDSTSIGQIVLSSRGIALAHCNFNRIHPEEKLDDLTTFI